MNSTSYALDETISDSFSPWIHIIIEESMNKDEVLNSTLQFDVDLNSIPYGEMDLVLESTMEGSKLLGIGAENNIFSTQTLPKIYLCDVSNGERSEFIP